jgi:hypothetical protein
VDERLVCAREVATGYGPADLLVLDESGTVGIVEWKLATNSEMKRTVVDNCLSAAHLETLGLARLSVCHSTRDADDRVSPEPRPGGTGDRESALARRR